MRKSLGKTRISKDCTLTALKTVRTILELEKGDEVEWFLEDQKIVLEKVK